MVRSHKYIFILVVVSTISFLQMDCNDDPPIIPPEPEKKVTLALQDTTCTEAWLQLKFTNFTAPHNYKIYRDTTQVFAGTLLANETTFIDEGLLPKRTYAYKAIRLDSGIARDSAVTNVTTMDTTSHEIEWEIHYFGDYGSNVLYDVAIIDENNIWAVGEVNMFDSLGQQQTEQYGFVRWDGNAWKVVKIYALYNLEVQFLYSLLPQAIKAFSPNDIWFANGSVYHWDGDTITSYYVNKFPGNPNPIWTKDRQRARTLGGTSSSNLYASGEEGALGYFDGSSWKNVETNTNYTGHDIFVDADLKSGGVDMFGLFSLRSVTGGVGSKLYKLNKDKIETEIPLPGISEQVVSLYGIYNKNYYASGVGLYVKRTLTDTTQWYDIQPIVTPYVTGKVSGTGVNDIYIVGSFGEFLHFNGVTWKSFQKHPLFTDVEFSKVVVLNKTIIVTGMYQSYKKGVVMIGKHN